MDANWAIVVAAVVTAVGGIVVAVIQQFRRENREDHGRVQAALYVISNTIKRVEGKVDHVQDGLNDHLKEHNNGRFVEGAADSISKAKGKVSRRPAQGSR